MNAGLKNIMQNMQRYNAADLAGVTFGLDKNVEYDALVVAPAWKPNKIIEDSSFTTTVLTEHSYISSYLVEKDGLKIAWVQTASGGGNLMDHLFICGELKFKKLIFIGAVGALKEGIELGDLCTPSYSVAGVYANAYLCEKLSDYKPFGKVYPDESYIDEVIALAKESGYELKKASVYCTDSIAMEYSHLEEIRAFDTDLIEMETSTFYEVAKLFEVPAVALLAVSDNSATGIPLIGRDDEQMKKYKIGRNVIIPDLIYKIAKSK
jgi:hypothetical protein